MVLLKILSAILIVSLFVYSKVNSYENQISVKYKKSYSIMKSVLEPILNFLNGFIKPHEIGKHLFINTSQLVLLVLLMFALIA